jgi:hypothetical protein
MSGLWIVVGSLAVWRVTHLVHAEDGPWNVISQAREKLCAFGRVTACFYCLSVWVAAPAAFMIGEGWRERAWLWPALSAAAILLERMTLNRGEPPPPIYVEDPQPPPEVLRPAADRPDPRCDTRQS